GLRAQIAHVAALDRHRLGDIEGLSLGNTLDDVEQHHVAEFLEPDELCERATNLARADQCNLLARHPKNIPNLSPEIRRRLQSFASLAGVNLFGPAIQVAL